MGISFDTYNQRGEFRLWLISSLFLLVTTDILTSPVLPKHTEIYSSMGNCFPVIQPGRQWILCPAFLLRQHDKGLIPTAGLVVYMHVCRWLHTRVHLSVFFNLCWRILSFFFFFGLCVGVLVGWGQGWGITLPPAPHTLPLHCWTGSKSCTGLPWQLQLSILVQHYYWEREWERVKGRDRRKGTCWRREEK